MIKQVPLSGFSQLPAHADDPNSKCSPRNQGSGPIQLLGSIAHLQGVEVVVNLRDCLWLQAHCVD